MSDVGIALDRGRIEVDVARRAHALHGAEVRRGRNDCDVAVKRTGEGVVHRADDVVLALAMAEDAVLVAEHLLSLSDGDADGEPVAGGGALDGGEVEAVREQPPFDEVDGVTVRRNEGGDVLLGEVLAVPRGRL